MHEFNHHNQPHVEAITELNADVCHNLTLGNVQDDGTLLPLDAQFLYSHRDPYAIATLFGQQKTRWTFARDLLASGIYEVTGEGDVLVWPSLSEEGQAVVMLEFWPQNPENTIVLQAESKQMAEFLNATNRVVPIHGEAIDFDAEIPILFR